MKLVRSERMKVRSENGTLINALEIHGVGLDRKFHRYKLDVTSQDAANVELAKRITEIRDAKARGLTSVDSVKPVALKDYFEKTYLPSVKGHLKAGTHAAYLKSFKTISAVIGSVPVQNLRAKDIRDFLTRQMNSRVNGDPLSGSTLNGYRRVLSACLSYAVTDEVIPSNPVRMVKAYPEVKRERWLTEEEVGSLLAECEGKSYEWLRPIIIVAVNTGFRVGEILALTWADTVNGTLRVTSITAKSKKTRHVKITPAIQEVLGTARQWQEDMNITTPHVFLNPDEDKAYTVRGVDDAFAKARKAVGFAAKGPDAVVFHTLRHTAISWMVQDDVPDREIMKQAGHGARHILDLYAHLRPGASDRSASALERRFSMAQKRAESVKPEALSYTQNQDCSEIAQELVATT